MKLKTNIKKKNFLFTVQQITILNPNRTKNYNFKSKASATYWFLCSKKFPSNWKEKLSIPKCI